MLWVSAAAAGGSVRPGQRRLQPPGPRAGAGTQCGTRRGAGGRRRGGGTAGHSARGEPHARRGGGERAAQESAPVRAREEEREPAGETALLAAPARTRPAQPCPARGPGAGPALVGAPDARREAFPPPAEVAARGGRRE